MPGKCVIFSNIQIFHRVLKNINFKINLGDCKISKVKEVHNNYDNDVITCNNEMHNNYDDNVIICNNEIMFIIY